MTKNMRTLVVVTCVLVALAAITFLVLVGSGIVAEGKAQAVERRKERYGEAQNTVDELAHVVRKWCDEKGLSNPPANLTLIAIDASFSELLDPWGNQYRLVVPGRIHASFDVISFGADGKVGGVDEAEDIVCRRDK